MPLGKKRDAYNMLPGKPEGRLGLIMNRSRQKSQFMGTEVDQDMSQKHKRHRTWICYLHETGVGESPMASFCEYTFGVLKGQQIILLSLSRRIPR
jgi:hypothetical protein